MKLRNLCHIASLALAAVWVQNASAQDDHWAGTPGNNAWNVPGNWSEGIVPPSGGAGFVGNVWLDAANGDSVITVPPGDVESPGVPPAGSTETYNTMFGPEWGVVLNIYGSLSYDWMMAPVQNDPTPGARTLINIYTNGSLSCVGATGTGGAGLGIGDAWWWYQAAPYVTLNMYGNAQLNMPNLGLGGHANVYDVAKANIGINIFTGNPLIGGTGNSNSVACSDGTASLLLGGGSLILPTGYTNETTQAGNTIYDLIARGVLRAYGKGFDTNDLIISDDGTNTTVACVPLGGNLQRVYFQPLLHANVTPGSFQQTVLVGDYPSVSGALLSSAEPGLDPASFPHPTYTSSNPNVATVDTNGIVTAVAPGKAILSATVGAFTSTNTVTLTVAPVTPNLIHRYSFHDAASSTTAADSIGGSAWAGTLSGDAVLSGSNLVLSGNVGSAVVLPPAILSNLDEVTIEVWATFPSTINPYANLFAFGSTDTGAFDTYKNDGIDYITFSPHTGGLTAQANFGQGVPGSAGERDAVSTGVLDNETNVHVVAVFHPLAGYEALYINGVLMAQTSMLNDLIDPVAYAGPTFNKGSILAYTLGPDPLNYIGESLYTGDPGLLANISEFRIYNTPLTAAQVAADHALGASQMIGTSTNVTLSASMSGTNLVVKWPTSSALVSLMASPQLGAGAVWTPANGSLTTDGNGHYQMTVAPSAGTQFFRLQQ